MEEFVEKTVYYHQQGQDARFKIWGSSQNHMIIYMCSEGGSLVCSEKVYPIQDGVLCFVGARKYHYTMPENPDIYDRSKLFFSERILSRAVSVLSCQKEFSAFAGGSLVFARIPEGEREFVDSIFREVKKREGDEKGLEPILLSCVMRLLVYMQEYEVESVAPANHAISKAVEYINRNIFSDIDIDNICDAIHISKYYFCRQFKAYTGSTVMEYILKTRITLARGLLEFEKHSITDVSEKCGFSSVSYFCRVFRKDTGYTPLQYRRKFGIT